MRWEDVRPIDEDLAELGCKLCVLRVDAEAIEERAVKARANPRWRAHLSSLGSGGREIADHYARQQERFLRLLEASSMTSAVIDTSGRSVAEAAEVSAFWLG